MELRKKRQSGFSIIELMSSIVVGSIMALAFGSVLLLIQNQTSTSTDIVDLKNNTKVIDTFVTNKIALCYGDSTKIYYNWLAEWFNIESDIGRFLHLTDASGTDYRITTSNDQLEWAVNDEPFFPIDMDVRNLLFQKVSSTRANRLMVSMDLVADNRTVNYGRMVYIRN